MAETEYDLLTAALIGAAVGAGLTLLLHHLPGGGPGRLERAGRYGDELVDRGMRASRKAGSRGARVMEQKYEDARDALRDTIEREVMRGVRRAVGRQRKRLGL
jgi:hypothetical protein